MSLHQMDINGFKSDLLAPPVWPIRTNGNQLHMQSFLGMRSAALIPPDLHQLKIPMVYLVSVSVSVT